MSDLNQCTITGRLGADVEIRRTQDGKPIANLRVASSETWRDRNSGERKEKTEWFNVVIFSEGLCKVAEQYLKKGSHVLLQGKIATRKWQDQSGNDRYSTELVLQGFDAKLIMLDGPSGERQSKPQRDQSSYDDYDEPKGQGQAANFSRDLDDDVPFLMEWR
ncbi:single-stranded DNA-binding protein [Sinorhizobium meliloti]|uniref:single-stranded DNA-binding protein n=1 Tax=Rhizobium meliloti TaxID=382 RepID=UPI000FD77310|nr:single-stranded DNA-binding protein [Sinorhizobium meliloti]RVQ10042.1 single-stranded DNA-binding protein [Sinorhizobium meliloti]RVQ55757.1 single-stranded DNA-binding protein [Sinorhizobium meliloti]